jgi:hypothetical protein
VITAELQVDRVEFGMTWSPLHMASMTAVGTVKARFTRVGDHPGRSRASARGALQAGLRLMARSGLRKDATYVGQTMAPWQRKLMTSPSATSKDSFRLE